MAEKKIHRVTLLDVARSCKLSVPTVSQILNKRASNFSSEETRRLVIETAQKLGYSPNFGYKIMRGISTRTVALVLGCPISLNEAYIQNLLYLLLDKLSKLEYSVYIETMPEEWNKHKSALTALLQRGAENLILLGQVCEWEDLDELEEKTGITVLTYDIEHRNSVRMNVALGFEGLLRHYIAKGCRNIRAIICENEPRIRAIRTVFGEERLPEIMIRMDKMSFRKKDADFLASAMKIGYNMTAELLAKEPDTDAILYLSDYFAIGGAKYILETGKKIGKDISLAGFNNTPAVQAYPFPISSVSHNLEKVSDIMIENFTKKESGVFTVDPILCIRD